MEDLSDQKLKACPRCQVRTEVWSQICPQCMYEWPQMGMDGKPVRKWTVPGVCLAIGFGLGLFVWPVLVIMSTFLFDSPGTSKEGLRYFIAFTSLGYPLLYLVAAWMYHKSFGTCDREWQRLLVWLLPAIPFLSLIVLFTLP